MKKICAAFVMCLVLGLSGGAWGASITDLPDLQAASVVDGEYYVLEDGAYVIDYSNAAGIDISADPTVNSLRVDDAATILTLDADGGAIGFPPLTVKDFEFGAGSLTALGGDATVARGVYVTGNALHSGSGTLTVKGGKGGTGMLVDGDFSQTGSGTVMADGGTKSDSHDSYGLFIIGSFDQSGDGLVSAFGGVGSGTAQSGVYVSQQGTQSGNARIEATGGSGTGGSHYGFYAGSTFTQNDNSSITATGGNGDGDSHIGFYMFSTFTQNDNSSITATGGSGTGDFHYGSYTNSIVTQNGNSTIVATGGSGAGSNHVGFFASSSSPVVQNDNSSIIATGGGGTGNAQYGFVANSSFTQNDNSSITATGGSGTGANQKGMHIQGIFTQGQDASVHAIGGAGTGGASAGTRAVGLYLYNSGTFNGTLILERQGAAASAYFFNTIGGSTVTFAATSVVVPKVDLAKPDALASGLMQGEKNGAPVITIANGATLKPEFANTLSLDSGQSRDLLFIDTSADVSSAWNGVIDGEFTLVATPSLTLTYDAYKNTGEDKYYLNITRVAHVDDVLAGIGGDDSRNAASLVEGIRTGVPGQTGAAADYLGDVYAEFDNISSEGEMVAFGRRVARGMTPHQDTRNPLRALNKQDAVMLDFSRNLALTVSQAAAVADARAGSDQALASAACLYRPWRLWANPVYQRANHRRADTPEFASAKEWFGGVALGVGRDFGMVAVGVNAHYLRGDVDASGYDAKSDTYGIALGARLHDLVPSGGQFNPWLEALAGYARENIDQDRLDYSGNWQKSKPDLDVFYASLTAGNEFRPTACFAISPLVGLEYAHIRQGGYRERGSGSLGLSTNADDHDSLRLKAGVEAGVMASERLDFTARAVYRYETMDRQTRLTSAFNEIPTVRFVTHGERLGRSSGNLGVGVGYRLGESARIGAAYDLWLSDRYVAHQGSVSISVGF